MKKEFKIALIVFILLEVLLLLFSSDWSLAYRSYHWYSFSFFEITIASLVISSIVYLFVRKFSKEKMKKESKIALLLFVVLELIVFLVGFFVVSGMLSEKISQNMPFKDKVEFGLTMAFLGLGPSGFISLIVYEISKRFSKEEDKTKKCPRWLLVILWLLIFILAMVSGLIIWGVLAFG